MCKGLHEKRFQVGVDSREKLIKYHWYLKYFLLFFLFAPKISPSSH